MTPLYPPATTDQRETTAGYACNESTVTTSRDAKPLTPAQIKRKAEQARLLASLPIRRAHRFNTDIAPSSFGKLQSKASI